MKSIILYTLVFVNHSVFCQNAAPREFPVKPELFVDAFKGCEGLAFNGEGNLFVTGNQSLWRVEADGTTTKITTLFSNLGIAPIGNRDLLVADFGPTNAFQHGKNSDGIIWRITPEGAKTELVKGIADPNFILVKKDRTFLVSDDATNEIFLCDQNGTVTLYCTAVNHPNGLAISPDESILYVAQIFQGIKPVIPDNRVWSISLINGKPARAAKLLTATGPGGANDGLAMDKLGRLYIAANAEGKIWRYDPTNDELVLIAEGMFGAASIAFGEGKFDHQSIFVSTTNSGNRGGKIYRVPVGIEGMPLNR